MSYRDSVPLGRPSVKEMYRAMTQRERSWFWVSVLNLALFAIVAVPLGGAALNGTVRGGHYFLMMGNVYTEVSRPVFVYSIIHSVSILITQPIGVVIALRATFRAKQSPN